MLTHENFINALIVIATLVILDINGVYQATATDVDALNNYESMASIVNKSEYVPLNSITLGLLYKNIQVSDSVNNNIKQQLFRPKRKRFKETKNRIIELINNTIQSSDDDTKTHLRPENETEVTDDKSPIMFLSTPYIYTEAMTDIHKCQ